MKFAIYLLWILFSPIIFIVDIATGGPRNLTWKGESASVWDGWLHLKYALWERCRWLWTLPEDEYIEKPVHVSSSPLTLAEQQNLQSMQEQQGYLIVRYPDPLELGAVINDCGFSRGDANRLPPVRVIGIATRDEHRNQHQRGCDRPYSDRPGGYFYKVVAE